MSCTLSCGCDPFTGKLQPEGIWKQFLRLCVYETGRVLEKTVFFVNRRHPRCYPVCGASLGIEAPQSSFERIPSGKPHAFPEAPPPACSTPSPRTSSSESARYAATSLPRRRFAWFARGPRLGVTSRKERAASGALRCQRPLRGRPPAGAQRARTRGLLRSVQPRGGGGNRGDVTAPRLPKGRSLPGGCGAPSQRARARPRPHVSLRPRGMWVREPSGLTCPRPPPPP